MKKKIDISSFLIGIVLTLLVVSCLDVFQNNEQREVVTKELLKGPIQVDGDKNVWKEKIMDISNSTASKQVKMKQIVKYARSYQATSDEIVSFESYLIDEFRQNRYRIQSENQLYMLQNLFIGSVVEKNTKQKDVSFHSFAVNFVRNTEYTFEGIEGADSELISINEWKMKNFLHGM